MNVKKKVWHKGTNGRKPKADIGEEESLPNNKKLCMSTKEATSDMAKQMRIESTELQKRSPTLTEDSGDDSEVLKLILRKPTSGGF